MSQTTLSTSQPNLKRKLVLGGNSKKEVTTESLKLPQPTGWRLLVLPFQMNEKTKGGLLLGQGTLERQQVASQCGNVLVMGPLHFFDEVVCGPDQIESARNLPIHAGLFGVILKAIIDILKPMLKPVGCDQFFMSLK